VGFPRKVAVQLFPENPSSCTVACIRTAAVAAQASFLNSLSFPSRRFWLSDGADHSVVLTHYAVVSIIGLALPYFSGSTGCGSRLNRRLTTNIVCDCLQMPVPTGGHRQAIRVLNF